MLECVGGFKQFNSVAPFLQTITPSLLMPFSSVTTYLHAVKFAARNIP
jgi:hypothetical protein